MTKQAEITTHEDRKYYDYKVDYGAKRKAHYRVIFENELTEEKEKLLHTLQYFVKDEVNTAGLINMKDTSYYRLIEKLARSFCGLTSPRQTADLDKAAIRQVIHETLTQLKEGGEIIGFNTLSAAER